jgi:hypothetical protein
MLEAALMSDDRLEALLGRALHEGALSRDELPAFADALREQARLILEARVRPLEERAAALAKEVAWRAETQQALEKEVAWRRSEHEARILRLARCRTEVGQILEMLDTAQSLTPVVRATVRDRLAALDAALAQEGTA